ncbi:MAG: hypothetical protein LRY27_01095 [Chitinophagales bacterium]|nr:hypothetical protein [Chitinophagales bacterium]
MLALIPLSIEFDVSAGLATDLPTEPLMAGFLLLSLFYLFKNANRIDFSFFKNSVAVLLFLHVVWIIVVSLFSTIPLFSFKYILAKLWYIAAFFIITATVIRSKEDIKKAFWCIFIPLTFTVLYTMFNHAKPALLLMPLILPCDLFIETMLVMPL